MLSEYEFEILIKNALSDTNICRGCGKMYRHCECEAMRLSGIEDDMNRPYLLDKDDDE